MNNNYLFTVYDLIGNGVILKHILGYITDFEGNFDTVYNLVKVLFDRNGINELITPEILDIYAKWLVFSVINTNKDMGQYYYESMFISILSESAKSIDYSVPTTLTIGLLLDHVSTYNLLLSQSNKVLGTDFLSLVDLAIGDLQNTASCYYYYHPLQFNTRGYIPFNTYCYTLDDVYNVDHSVDHNVDHSVGYSVDHSVNIQNHSTGKYRLLYTSIKSVARRMKKGIVIIACKCIEVKIIPFYMYYSSVFDDEHDTTTRNTEYNAIWISNGNYLVTTHTIRLRHGDSVSCVYITKPSNCSCECSSNLDVICSMNRIKITRESYMADIKFATYDTNQ